MFFVNEEPPFFQTNQMGSLAYAQKLRREGVRVSAMISLETVGFYSDNPGSQKYPPLLSWLYPSRGNFVGFVANTESRDLVRRQFAAFVNQRPFHLKASQLPQPGRASHGPISGLSGKKVIQQS